MFRSIIFVGVMLFALSTVAAADPAKVAPSGWQKSKKSDLTIYQSPTGREMMVFRTVDEVSDPKLAVSIISDSLTAKADKIVSARSYVENSLIIQDTVFRRRGVDMHVRVFGVRRADGVFQTMAHMAPTSEPKFNSRLITAGKKMAALAEPSAKATQSSPSASSNDPLSDTSYAAPIVKSVLFELSYKFGVGGGAYPVYEPVVLYTNGFVVKPGATAIDEINISEFERDTPKSVGKWKLVGSKYEVVWTGKTKAGDPRKNTLDPKVGPPKPLPKAELLRGSYQMIGGGGNIAFGGTTMTVQAKTITFGADGRFSFSDKRSASSGAGVGNTDKTRSGTWTLDDATLTLNFKGGETIRTPVFYSASRKKSAEFGIYGVLWIGGKNYQRIKKEI